MQEFQNNNITFVCISDTHNRHNEIKIPNGDVLIHAGDFTGVGDTGEILSFIEFLKQQPHKHKIVIAGNHELSLDLDNYNKFTQDTQFKHCFKQKQSKEKWIEQKKELQKHCIYLENDMTEIYGYKIFGSPCTVEFSGWAFMKEPQELKHIWECIPSETDILITHGPPQNIRDKCRNGDFAGCPHLREEVLNRIKPLYHIFGHIHSAYGQEKINNIQFMNVASLNSDYQPVNEPVVFQLPFKK